MADKLVWLTYGAHGENLIDPPPARWLPFADDATAQASTAYEGYAWAIIADTLRGKPRLDWTADSGWKTVNYNSAPNTSTVHPPMETIKQLGGFNKRDKDAVAADDTAVSG